ncbi:hypothetical protein ACHAXM_001696 [Skeletonema potamos]|jgi:hypothetical protein
MEGECSSAAHLLLAEDLAHIHQVWLNLVKNRESSVTHEYSGPFEFSPDPEEDTVLLSSDSDSAMYSFAILPLG